MANTAARPAAPAEKPRSSRLKPAVVPFFGLIDAVIVESPVDYEFEGAVPRDAAAAGWQWIGRDLVPDMLDIEIAGDDAANAAALETLIPDILAQANAALREGEANAEKARRLRSQLGTDDSWDKLPTVLNALRTRAVLVKAQAFGRAANAMADEAGLVAALQAMPLQDSAVASLMMMATVGQITNPSQLVLGAIHLSGNATEAALARSGFAPLIDALLAHAQNQLHLMSPIGTFSDIDLLCRAVDRFHRLIRAVNGYVELARNGRWAAAIGGLIKTVSDRIEPRLREAGPDVNRAMRRREGTDRLDSDQILLALNGVYLCKTVRDCRASLALNTVFDQVWAQVGQALEIHIERSLEILRANPADKTASARLEAGIKMAELRFTSEYAEVLRRAKDAAERRINQQA